MCITMEEMRNEAARANLISNLKTLMETMHLTLEQAMDVLRVSVDDRTAIMKRI